MVRVLLGAALVWCALVCATADASPQGHAASFVHRAAAAAAKGTSPPSHRAVAEGLRGAPRSASQRRRLDDVPPADVPPADHAPSQAPTGMPTREYFDSEERTIGEEFGSAFVVLLCICLCACCAGAADRLTAWHQQRPLGTEGVQLMG